MNRNQDLFGTGVTIHGDDFENIPLITESSIDDVEVLVPGHTYSPVLIEHAAGKIDVGPGALIESEKKFVIDLLTWLCPNKDFPRHPSTPIRKDGIEYYLRRNIESNAGSARFRIDAENWFYPDFVLWIVDPAKSSQTIVFIDPKGLRSLEGGWRNHKILSSLFSVAEAQVSLETGGKTIKDASGRKISSFKLAAAIVSTTAYNDLEKTAEYDLAEGRRPTVEEFNRAGIWFPSDQPNYIESMLASFETPSVIAGAMSFAAKVWNNLQYDPATELECYLAALIRTSHDDEKSRVLERFLRNTLAGGAKAADESRSELLKEAKKGGVFGLGAESAVSIRDNPNPCCSWWESVKYLPSSAPCA
ncbi:hypothetical protein MASR1M60_10670 [Rhodocyclaceae bacterium]